MCVGCPTNCIKCDTGLAGQELDFNEISGHGECGCADGFQLIGTVCTAINPNGCDAMNKYSIECAIGATAPCCSNGATPGTDACDLSCYLCTGPEID
jgi:hypothetical protein